MRQLKTFTAELRTVSCLGNFDILLAVRCKFHGGESFGKFGPEQKNCDF